ncbi:hypothetical protein NHX12_019852, partial [Muraenolepis orangiensis]
MATKKKHKEMVIHNVGTKVPTKATRPSLPPSSFVLCKPMADGVGDGIIFSDKEEDLLKKSSAVIAIPENLTAKITCQGVSVTLDNNVMWNKFFRCQTEMILTQDGSRMFPYCRFHISGLDACKKYSLVVDVQPVDSSRYEWTGHDWRVAGKATRHVKSLPFSHPESPSTGQHWMEQPVSFYKLKLTNIVTGQANLVLHPLHRYLPCLHVIPFENGKKELKLNGPRVLTFTFPQTEFFAVTAFQNSRFTQLKVDYNPFAKGLKDEKSRSLALKHKSPSSMDKKSDSSNDQKPAVKKSLKSLLANYKPRISTAADHKDSDTSIPAATSPTEDCSSKPLPSQKLFSELIREAHVSLRRCNLDNMVASLKSTCKANAEFEPPVPTVCMAVNERSAMASCPAPKSHIQPSLALLDCKCNTKPQPEENVRPPKRPALVPLPALARFLSKHRNGRTRQMPLNIPPSAAPSASESAPGIQSPGDSHSGSYCVSPLSNLQCQEPTREVQVLALQILVPEPKVPDNTLVLPITDLPLSTSEQIHLSTITPAPEGLPKAVDAFLAHLPDSSTVLPCVSTSKPAPLRPDSLPDGFEPLSPTSSEPLSPLPVSLELETLPPPSVHTTLKWHSLFPPPDPFFTLFATFPPTTQSPAQTTAALPFPQEPSVTPEHLLHDDEYQSLPFPGELSPLTLQLSMSPSFSSLDGGALSPTPSLSDLLSFISTDNNNLLLEAEIGKAELVPVPCPLLPLTVPANRPDPCPQVQSEPEPTNKHVKGKKKCRKGLSKVATTNWDPVYTKMQPSLEEVEEQLFVSFTSKEALKLHLQVSSEAPGTPLDSSSEDPQPTAPPQEGEPPQPITPSPDTGEMVASATEEHVSTSEGLKDHKESIAALQKTLLRDLKLMKNRQAIHPVLQEVGLKMHLLDSALVVDLQYLGVRLPIPPHLVSLEAQCPSPRAPPPLPPQPAATAEPPSKNLSAFCSDMLDEYLENEGKFLDQQTSSFPQALPESVDYELPTQGSSYIWNPSSVLKNQPLNTPTSALISSFIPPSKRPRLPPTTTKKSKADRKQKTAASKLKSKPASDTGCQDIAPLESDSELGPAREEAPSPLKSFVAVTLLKQRDLEDGIVWEGHPRTCITEDRATIALTSLFTTAGFVQDDPTAPIQLVKRRAPPCLKDFCRLGCVCSSLAQARTITHCGKVQCMLGCSCLRQKVVLLKNLEGSDSSPSDLDPSKRKRKKRMKMAYVLKETDSVAQPAQLVRTLLTGGDVDPEPTYTPEYVPYPWNQESGGKSEGLQEAEEPTNQIRNNETKLANYSGNKSTERSSRKATKTAKKSNRKATKRSKQINTIPTKKISNETAASTTDLPTSKVPESVPKLSKHLVIVADCRWPSSAVQAYVLKALCLAMVQERLHVPLLIDRYYAKLLSFAVKDDIMNYKVHVTELSRADLPGSLQSFTGPDQIRPTGIGGEEVKGVEAEEVKGVEAEEVKGVEAEEVKGVEAVEDWQKEVEEEEAVQPKEVEAKICLPFLSGHSQAGILTANCKDSDGSNLQVQVNGKPYPMAMVQLGRMGALNPTNRLAAYLTGRVGHSPPPEKPPTSYTATVTMTTTRHTADQKSPGAVPTLLKQGPVNVLPFQRKDRKVRLVPLSQIKSLSAVHGTPGTNKDIKIISSIRPLKDVQVFDVPPPTAGSSGTALNTGPAGSSGTALNTGPAGSSGTALNTGPAGSSGTALNTGPAGSSGTALNTGPAGSSGTTLNTGPAGSSGMTLNFRAAASSGADLNIICVEDEPEVLTNDKHVGGARTSKEKPLLVGRQRAEADAIVLLSSDPSDWSSDTEPENHPGDGSPDTSRYRSNFLERQRNRALAGSLSRLQKEMGLRDKMPKIKILKKESSLERLESSLKSQREEHIRTLAHSTGKTENSITRELLQLSNQNAQQGQTGSKPLLSAKVIQLDEQTENSSDEESLPSGSHVITTPSDVIDLETLEDDDFLIADDKSLCATLNTKTRSRVQVLDQAFSVICDLKKESLRSKRTKVVLKRRRSALINNISARSGRSNQKILEKLQSITAKQRRLEKSRSRTTPPLNHTPIPMNGCSRTVPNILVRRKPPPHPTPHLPHSSRAVELVLSQPSCTWFPHLRPSLLGHYPTTRPSLLGHYPTTRPSLLGHYPTTRPSLLGHYPTTRPPLLGHYPNTRPSLLGHYPTTRPSLL